MYSNIALSYPLVQPTGMKMVPREAIGKKLLKNDRFIGSKKRGLIKMDIVFNGE